MHVLLVYDIPDDKARAKVADACMDYGLDRVQYSAFHGDLTRVFQEELMQKAKKQLGKRPGKIYLFPICEKDWLARVEIEQKEKVSDTAGGE